MIPILVIEGATATGKSKLALELAGKLNSEIISADSRQVYKYMDIGTAKPSMADRTAIPHHLIDVINPKQAYSAGSFINDATEAVSKIHSKGILPIISGGTGFYIKAFLNGLFEASESFLAARSAIEEIENSAGKVKLYNLLCEVDPDAVKRIHQNDIYRIKRALEVWKATGKPISKHWEEQKEVRSQYNCFRILIDIERDTLYERINQRMDKMIEMGLLPEIESLLEMGYDETSPGLSSLGYREFLPLIKKESNLAACLEMAKQNSRNYAKRQLTWYRKQNFDLIYNGSESLKNILEKADERLSFR